jgi:hypothetical protein
MMRFLKSVNIADSGHIIRICAQWLSQGLGLRIVEYRIGNSFTGSIDILAVDKDKIYLVTINTGKLSDSLLGALTGYRWYLENREFLARVYQPGEIDFTLPTILMILSPSFPPEINSILQHGLKADVRLFQYVILGSEKDPDIYVEEICTLDAPRELTQSFAGITHELGVEKAGLTQEEISEFLIAMRA